MLFRYTLYIVYQLGKWFRRNFCCNKNLKDMGYENIVNKMPNLEPFDIYMFYSILWMVFLLGNKIKSDMITSTEELPGWLFL